MREGQCERAQTNGMRQDRLGFEPKHTHALSMTVRVLKGPS